MKARILLAPLEGVTERCFRSCFYDHFPGLAGALTPFLPIPDRVKRIPRRLLEEVALPGESRVHEIPQILVSESSAFLLSARFLEEAGYRDLNWNLGCPSRGVVRKGKGSGMMPRTDEILEILDTVLPLTKLRISLKLRLGLEEEGELYRLLPRLKSYPVDLILHPRLGSQMYGGRADTQGFRKALDLYGKALCYNGDIRRASDLRGLEDLFPEVDEWMIGRGLLADPFLLEDILKGREEGGRPALGRKAFHAFLDDLMDRMRGRFSGEGAFFGYMKGILSYSFHDERVPGAFFAALKRMKNGDDWKRLREGISCWAGSQ
jgi:tRNA-dihydrouridine synthase